MPIYDKPMIYYPLTVLMLAGIREVLIITTPEDQSAFKRLLSDGSQWWISISYAVQPSPDGLAQAFIIGEEFIGSDDVCLVLGDNLFYGQWLSGLLQWAVRSVREDRKSVVFGYEVVDPHRYGVVEFDADRRALSIEEKPKDPKSNYAVVGLYFYTNDVIEVAKNVTPSERWELEITSVNEVYLKKNALSVEIMNRGFAWLDTGTHESMTDASNFISIIEKRQWLKVWCPEEIAYLNNWITGEGLRLIAQPLLKSQYWQYLLNLIK